MVGQLDELRTQLMRYPSFCLLTLLACAIACSERNTALTAANAQSAHVAAVVAAGGVVDSILPLDEHLQRFRQTVQDRPDTLRHASSSRDALVERWTTAVATHDTVALNAMVIDRAEFGWLYYPTSHLMQPPYEAPPELLWGQILANSDEGARKILHKIGGLDIELERVSCPDGAVTEGSNRLHDRCLVTLRVGAERHVDVRLFGTILERDGRFKFISFANML